MPQKGYPPGHELWPGLLYRDYSGGGPALSFLSGKFDGLRILRTAGLDKQDRHKTESVIHPHVICISASAGSRRARRLPGRACRAHNAGLRGCAYALPSGQHFCQR